MDPLQSVEACCPYCGERLEMVVDCSAGAQSYIEDCQVCCRPIVVTAEIGPEGGAELRLAREDD